MFLFKSSKGMAHLTCFVLANYRCKVGDSAPYQKRFRRPRCGSFILWGFLHVEWFGTSFLVQIQSSGAFFHVKWFNNQRGLVCFWFIWFWFNNSRGLEWNNYCSLSGGFCGGRRKAASRSESVQSEDDSIPIRKVWNKRKILTIHCKRKEMTNTPNNSASLKAEQIPIESIVLN